MTANREVGKKKEESTQLDFGTSRYEYCLRLLEKEEKLKEVLEKKARFYLSFITVFLGAMFLKLDYLESVKEMFIKENPSVFVRLLIYVIISVFLVCIMIALVSVLKCVRVKEYMSGSPDNLAHSLFMPDSRFTRQKSNACLFMELARYCAVAVDENRELNAEKGKWLSICSGCLFISSVSLFALIVAVGGIYLL